MATFPARYHWLAATVASLAPQVDALMIYANGPRHGFPSLRRWPNVDVTFAEDSRGDLSAKGKLEPLRHLTDAYVFTVDDDIIYPPDYVVRLRSLLDALQRRCCVAVHASILPDRVRWYYERTSYFGGDEVLDFRHLANLAGTGTVAFHQSALALDVDAFPEGIGVDLPFSLAVARADLPIVVVARSAGWLRFRSGPGLLAQFRRRLNDQSRLARQADWSFGTHAARLRRVLASVFGGVDPADLRRLGLDPELVSGLLDGETPSAWARGPRLFERRRRYLGLARRT